MENAEDRFNRLKRIYSLTYTDSGVGIYITPPGLPDELLLPYEYHEYDSLQDLFLALLYPELDIKDKYVTDKWKHRVFMMLNTILSDNYEINSTATLPQRFILYQQLFDQVFSYDVMVQKDQILCDFDPNADESFYFALQASTYGTLSMLATEQHLEIPVRTYYGFNTATDLCNWVLDAVISENPIIARCSNCEKYFFPYRTSQLYCSKQCKNADDRNKRYGPFEDTRKKIAAIEAFFTRKLDAIPNQDDDKSYEYIYIPPVLPDEYDANILWSTAKVDITQPVHLTAFRDIKAAYDTLNAPRYAVFIDAYDAFRQKKGANGTELQALYRAHTDYHDWLENVRKQLAAFSRDERKVQAYKNKLKRQKASPKT